MAELYFPFNSVSGDREYTAPDFARYFADIISSGVSANGDNLPVASSGGLNLSVGAGLAWIRGHLYYNTESKSLKVDPGDTTPRIDRVVTRLDVAGRKIETVVEKGTPATTGGDPTPPDLKRDDDYYDICLAEVYVDTSAVEIAQKDIADTRTDNEVCGVIRTLIETLDVGDFMKNCRDSFDTWFADIRYVMDGDVALNLKNQIDALAAEYRAEFDALADSVQKEVVQIRTDLNNGVYSTPATVVIHTIPGATVTMALGSTSYSETADDDGCVTFTTRTLGTYTLTATTSGSSFTVQIDVKVIGIIEISLMSFADMSWADINTIAASGLAKQVFKIGDEKAVNLTSGEAVTFRLEAFEYDNLDTGGKAKLTIGMKNLLAGTYAMNNAANTTGGWDSSVMRRTTIPLLLSQLPSDLQAVIKPVIKKTTAGGTLTEITTTTDKLWLFSPKELGLQTTVEGDMDEGDTYPRYVSNESRIKYMSDGSGAAADYWTRSPSTAHTAKFGLVTAEGAWSSYSAVGSYGVCFGFCI